jgi:hypothetical protein
MVWVGKYYISNFAGSQKILFFPVLPKILSGQMPILPIHFRPPALIFKAIKQ